ncbi:MAG: type II toxin-antitoxin system VapC family toxin [Dehalococcoidia bacterium]
MTTVALDSNILVAAFEPSSPAFDLTTALLRTSVDRGIEFVTPPFCIGEFWRVATEPSGYGRGVEAATAFLREWIRLAPVAALRPRFASAVLEDLGRVRPLGAAVFDVLIGASARDAGASQLWTFDQRFPSIERLRVVRRPLLEVS